MVRSVNDLAVSDCDDCGREMSKGWLVPTGRTDTLGENVVPIVEIVCQDCYEQRKP